MARASPQPPFPPPGCPLARLPARGWLCLGTARGPGYRRVPGRHTRHHAPNAFPDARLLPSVCSRGCGEPASPKGWGGSACFCQPSAAGAAAGLQLRLLRAFSCRTQAALKKYQTEQRSKGDSLDKCQAELKKLRKKSQGSKNPQKYSEKELQVGTRRWGARASSSRGAAADGHRALEAARRWRAFR